MEALSDLELRELTNGLRDRLEEGETLDDLLPESFAATREAARRSARPAPFRRPAPGRRGAALGQDRRDAHRRGQDADRHPGRRAERPERSRRSRRHGQRLPRQARHAVDGSGLRRARSVGRLHPARRGVHLRPRLGRPRTSGWRDCADFRAGGYAADITYGTNNEFGFDYLRDNMVPTLDRMVQRELAYAIVDEVDNILIDEARTPLIISGQAEQATDRYYQFAQIVKQLREGRTTRSTSSTSRSSLTEDGIDRRRAAARAFTPARASTTSATSS